MAIQIKIPLLSVKSAKKRKTVWIASRHASLAVAMTGTETAFFNSMPERFRQRSSHLKRSISLFLRNSGRETGSHFRWNCSRAIPAKACPREGRVDTDFA